MGRWKIAVPIADFDWGEHNERHQENYGFPVNGPPNKMHHTVDMGEGTMNPNYDKLKRVLKGGLVPRNWHIRPQDTEGEYGGRSYLQSRPNHVYLGEYPWTPYGLPQIHVDKKHLDPQLMNPDEDYWGSGTPGEWLLKEHDIPSPTKAEVESHIESNPDAPHTLGEWAHDYGDILDEHALDALEENHTIAYNGAIPAEHIELNPAWYKRHALMRNTDAEPIPDWLQEHVAIQHPEVAQNAQADNSFRKEIKQDGSFLSKKLDHFYTMSRDSYPKLPVALVQDSMRELANRMADTEATLTRQKYSPDQIKLKMDEVWDDLMPFYDSYFNLVNQIQTRAPGFRFPYEDYPDVLHAAQDAQRISAKMNSNEGFDPTKEFERYEPPKQSNTWREAAFVKEAPHKTPESEMGIYGWPAIMLKAQRLRNEGRVLVTHNDGKTVVGQVEGDHNLYDTEIYREDPNSAVITWWDCTCLLPGAKIVMADGTLKPVEAIKTGDSVLTATGETGKVGKTFALNYAGEVCGLKLTGFTDTVWMTSDHKLPNPDFEFKEIKEWKEGEYTFLPQPQYSFQKEIDVKKFLPDLIEDNGFLFKKNVLYGSKRVTKTSRPKSRLSARQTPIPSTIKMDKNFARLAGLFVAEGMITKHGELRWSFGPPEEFLVDEVIELLKIYGLNNPTKTFVKHAWSVAIGAKAMADLFKILFGTGARNKKLHPIIMAMPLLELEVFFDAWFVGDGHEAQGGRNTLATASDDLAMQARLILSLLNRESVIRVKQDNSSPLVPGGKSLNVLAWRRNGGNGKNVRFFKKGQVYQKVESIVSKPYKGLVYNFEVSNNHTYVIAPGFASSNCPWRKFAFGRTRKWKKYEARICSHGLALYWESLKGKKQAVPASLPADEIADYPANYNVRNPGQEIPLPYVAPESIPAMEAEEKAQEQEEGNFPPILGEPLQENPVNLENPDIQRLTKTIKDALNVVYGRHNPNHHRNTPRWIQKL